MDRDDQWADRAALGTFPGLPWWGAVLLPLGLTALGGVVDHGLGPVFQGAYLLGCVLAVCLVRRRSLFTPMVQPPLILAVVAPSVALLSSGSAHSGGWVSTLITVGTPLVDSFTILIVTSVVSLVVGCARLILQRKPLPDPIPA